MGGKGWWRKDNRQRTLTSWPMRYEWKTELGTTNWGDSGLKTLLFEFKLSNYLRNGPKNNTIKCLINKNIKNKLIIQVSFTKESFPKVQNSNL